MNDDFLTQFRRTPRPAFASTLYRRINSPLAAPAARWTAPRLALAGAAMLALLLATVLATPGGQAAASALGRQIGFITLVDASAAPGAVVPPMATAIPASVEAQVVASATAASELTGFPVLAPTYLPAGYALDGSWWVTQRDGSAYAGAVYGTPEGYFLNIGQGRAAEGEHYLQPYGANEQVSDVSVRGQTGAWITGRLMNLSDEPATPDTLTSTNWLIWEENGVTLVLYSDSLSQEAMLQIAASLAP